MFAGPWALAWYTWNATGVGSRGAVGYDASQSIAATAKAPTRTPATVRMRLGSFRADDQLSNTDLSMSCECCNAADSLPDVGDHIYGKAYQSPIHSASVCTWSNSGLLHH